MPAGTGDAVEELMPRHRPQQPQLLHGAPGWSDGEDLPGRMNMLPPEVSQGGLQQAPVLPIPGNPKQAAPVGGPAVEVQPVSVQDLHQTLSLGHVKDWNLDPWQGARHVTLEEGALDLQNPLRGQGPAGDHAIRRGGEPVIAMAALPVHLEVEQSDVVTGGEHVLVQGELRLELLPLGCRVSREGFHDAELLQPQLSPPPVPHPNGRPEGARRQLALPQLLPGLALILKAPGPGIIHRTRPENQRKTMGKTAISASSCLEFLL